MTQPPDPYKERELRYKRFDVYFRGIAAIAAVVSAIAAFPLLRNVLSSAPTSVQKPSTVTPSTPANPSPPAVTSQPPSSAATGFTPSIVTPTTPATGFTQSNQTVQPLPQVIPAKPQPSLQRDRGDDDDDNNDDRNDDDQRDNKRDDDD